jgi:DNA-binding NtrC family response regulator
LTDGHVLVVHDDPALRFLVCCCLEDVDLACEEASDARTAAERLGHPGTRAVVVGLRLPDASGLEVAASVRDRRGDLPVVLFASFVAPDAQAEAERLGVLVLDGRDPEGMASAVAQLVRDGGR